MNEVMRERLWRHLETLPEERLYQVLDYIEFLSSRYARVQAKDPSSALQRFGERLEDGMRRNRVGLDMIRGTMQAIGHANRWTKEAKSFGESLWSDLSRPLTEEGQGKEGREGREGREGLHGGSAGSSGALYGAENVERRIAPPQSFPAEGAEPKEVGRASSPGSSPSALSTFPSSTPPAQPPFSTPSLSPTPTTTPAPSAGREAPPSLDRAPGEQLF